MKIFLAHTEDMLPDDVENVVVTLPSSNPGIQLFKQGNCPEPSPLMYAWLQANCKDDVYFSYHQPINDGGPWRTIIRFDVYIWFADVSQAMMFKLAWGGRL